MSGKVKKREKKEEKRGGKKALTAEKTGDKRVGGEKKNLP